MRLSQLLLNVGDADRSKAFYCDVLGFPLRADEGEGQHRCVHVVAGDAELLIHGNAGADFRAGSPHALIYLDVRDLDGVVTRLREASFDVTEETEYGREAIVRDPDGYPLCLREHESHR